MIETIHRLCKASGNNIIITDAIDGRDLLNTKKLYCFGVNVNPIQYVYYIDIASFYFYCISLIDKINTDRVLEQLAIVNIDKSKLTTQIENEICLGYGAAAAIYEDMRSRGFIPKYVMFSDVHNEFISLSAPMFLQRMLGDKCVNVLIGDPCEAKFNLWNRSRGFAIDDKDDELRSSIIEQLIIKTAKSPRRLILLHGNHDWEHSFESKYKNIYSRIVIHGNKYKLIVCHSLLSTDAESILVKQDKVLKINGDSIECWKFDFTKSRYKTIQTFVQSKGLVKPDPFVLTGERIKEASNDIFKNETDAETTSMSERVVEPYSIYNYLTAPAYLRCISNPYNAFSEEVVSIEAIERKLQKLCGYKLGMNVSVIIGHSFDFSAFPYLMTRHEKKIPLFKNNSRKGSLWLTKVETLPDAIKQNDQSRMDLYADGYPILSNLYEVDGNIYQSMQELFRSTNKTNVRPAIEGNKVDGNKGNIDLDKELGLDDTLSGGNAEVHNDSSYTDRYMYADIDKNKESYALRKQINDFNMTRPGLKMNQHVLSIIVFVLILIIIFIAIRVISKNRSRERNNRYVGVGRR